MRGYNNIIIHKSFNSGSNIITSGPINIRSKSIIKDITVFVNETLQYPYGILGINAGTSENGQEVIKYISNSLAPNSTTLSEGRGTSTTDTLKTAYAGNKTLTLVPVVISTSNTYYNTDGQLYVTVTSSAGAFTAGVVTFYIEYITLKSI
jgi:hypothetical protein